MIGRGNFDPLFNRWYFQQVLRQAAIFAAFGPWSRRCQQPCSC